MLVPAYALHIPTLMTRHETPRRHPVEPIVPQRPQPGETEIEPQRQEPEIAPSRRTAPEIFPEESPDATPPHEHPTEPSQPGREIEPPGDPVVPPR